MIGSLAAHRYQFLSVRLLLLGLPISRNIAELALRVQCRCELNASLRNSYLSTLFGYE